MSVAVVEGGRALIRRATANDVAAMFEVRTGVRENHLSMQQLATLGITPETLPPMLDGDGRGWIADVDGEVVGFSMADARQATVFGMFMRSGHEGRGIGRALMAAAEDWLFATGCTRIWLLTDADPQVRANGFYRHLGWIEDAIEDDGQMRFIKHAPVPAPAASA
jgi:GNAT superfamily N-acetyltransferase